MNSDQIFDLIEQIAATSSKNEKIELLKEGCKHKEFRDALTATYNPLITYGIDDVPERREDLAGAEHFDEGTRNIIDHLANRSLTGNEARDTVAAEMGMLTPKSAELLKRIIKKDLRAGFSGSSCNKAHKGLIPEFPYMRCSLPKDAKLDEWPWGTDGALSQEKADGMFANIDHEATGAVRITSRQGSEFPLGQFAELVGEVKTRLLPGTQTHGELLVTKDGKVLPREIGNGILNSVLNGGEFGPGEVAIYKAWDSIPLTSVQPKGRYEVPYRTRLRGMIVVLRDNPGKLIQVIETKLVKSLSEAYQHAGELMRSGKEGTIIKHPNAHWRDGTSKEQVKIKLEFSVDLRVVAILPGEKDTKNEGRAGALACETSCGKLQVNVAVKNEAMRDDVDANPEEWIDSIIEVVANDIMLPSESSEFYSLFLPRMVVAGYRTDKTEADDLDRVIAAKEGAVLGTGLFRKAA